MVRLREYYCDANAPRAHDVLPAAFAAVRNSAGELLLVRRIDVATGSCPEAGSRSANPSAKPLSVKSPKSPALPFCSSDSLASTATRVMSWSTQAALFTSSWHVFSRRSRSARRGRPTTSRRHRDERGSLVRQRRYSRSQDAPSDAATNRQCPSRARPALH